MATAVWVSMGRQRKCKIRFLDFLNLPIGHLRSSGGVCSALVDAFAEN